jgi:hypothetical protein
MRFRSGLAEIAESRKTAFTAQEIAELLNVSVMSVYRLFDSGLPYIWVLGSKRVDPKVLSDWIRSHHSCELAA